MLFWIRRWGLWPWIVLLGLILVAALAGAWQSEARETSAIRALPRAQREALYRRTMENLRTVCDPAPPRCLREFCRAEAVLAARFPECDEACVVLTHRHRALLTH